MLSKILKIVSTGDLRSTESIAEQIGTSQEAARVMIEDLVRLGYLRKVRLEVGGCKTPCKGCSGNCCCYSDGLRGWELTDKAETT